MTEQPDTSYVPSFEPTYRPVRRHETTLLVDGTTGEVVGWNGLNDDVERCPLESCGANCGKGCQCAPCRCSECGSREASARRPVPPPAPRLQLVE